jgi:hypothetical protein
MSPLASTTRPSTVRHPKEGAQSTRRARKHRGRSPVSPARAAAGVARRAPIGAPRLFGTPSSRRFPCRAFPRAIRGDEGRGPSVDGSSSQGLVYRSTCSSTIRMTCDAEFSRRCAARSENDDANLPCAAGPPIGGGPSRCWLIESADSRTYVRILGHERWAVWRRSNAAGSCFSRSCNGRTSRSRNAEHSRREATGTSRCGDRASRSRAGGGRRYHVRTLVTGTSTQPHVVLSSPVAGDRRRTRTVTVAIVHPIRAMTAGVVERQPRSLPTNIEGLCAEWRTQRERGAIID